jgi:hypothetical protein
MKTKRIYLALLVVTFCAAVISAIILASSRAHPTPCRRTFEQVHVGMTRDEVRRIVGGSPGVYGGEDNLWPASGGVWLFDHELWQASETRLFVHFNSAGQADDVVIEKGHSLKPTIWKRCRTRLGL